MVNSNIQAPINLVGRGLVNKPNGNYESGEFSIARNVELVDNQIVTRRPIQYHDGSTSPTDGEVWYYPYGFIGEFYSTNNTDFPYSTICSFLGGRFGGSVGDASSVLISANTPFSSPFTNPVLGDITGTPPAITSSYPWRKVVGTFYYNGDQYYLIDEYNSTTLTQTVYINKNSQNVTGATVVYTQNTSPVVKDRRYFYRSFFIYKERVWVVTNNGIYFSKATDPLTWAVPDGGFLRVQGAIRYCAKPAGDNIFIGTDRTIQAFTFTSDPNTDGYMRMISNQGIYDLEVVQDTVVGIDADQLFQISNTSIELITALSDIYYEIPRFIMLRASGDNLLLINGAKLEISATLDSQYLNPALLGDSIKVLNLRTLFVSEWSYFASDGTDFDFVIADAYYQKDYGITHLLMVSKSTAKAGLFYMVEDSKLCADDNVERYPSSFRGNDSFFNLVSGLDQYYPIDVELEIKDFSPDASEYRFKKFRNLMFEGVLPADNFEVGVAFDNEDYIPSNITALEALPPILMGVKRAPYPYRIGINQRGKSISIRFKTTLPDNPVPTETISHFFSLRDMRLLWSYLGKTVGDHGATTGDIVAP